MTTLQQIEAVVSLADRFGRKLATAEEAREIMKIGVWYDSVDETLLLWGQPVTVENHPGAGIGGARRLR
jgi:hypothetical protein